MASKILDEWNALVSLLPEQGELRASVRSELTGLVGRYPDPATAARWKSALKAIRDDEIFRAG